jgi:hypothetical protein
MFFFCDTFRCERSLTYRRALAHRRGRTIVLSLQPDAESTKVPVVSLDVVDTIESKEKMVFGNGPSSCKAEWRSAREFRSAQMGNKTRATFPKRGRAQEWLGSGVHGLLFLLPQVCDGATV